jgi:crotonobetainyl-CoA:carnitine CoA-transferase CaiB-like acyl-CoA transferase
MTSQDSAAFLRGLSVLQLTAGAAGAAAGSFLASLGASVHVYDSQEQGCPAKTISHLADFLDEGKPRISHEDWTVATAGYDVILCDRVAHRWPAGTHVREYVELVSMTNQSVWVSLTAFGLAGPDADRLGSNLVMTAASGLLSIVRDVTTGQPLMMRGGQAVLCIGQVGALAALHGLDRFNVTGDPVHVEVSGQEAVLATGPFLQFNHRLLEGNGEVGAGRFAGPMGWYPCADGLIRISVMEEHQWTALTTAMGGPDWAAGIVSFQERLTHAAQIEHGMAAWTAQHSKFESEAMLQSHGVPATAVRSPQDLLESRQLAERGTLRSQHTAEGTIRVINTPYTVVARPPEGTGRKKPRSLRGLRVAEFSHVLAVPLAGSILGAMGADVIKIEDPNRLDLYRRRAPFVGGEEGDERGAYFASGNHSKSSMTAGFEENPEALADLLNAADVVVENFGRRRASRIGISAEILARSHPHLLALSSSGFGYTGPWAEYKAYAYNIHAMCGACFVTRDSEDHPVMEFGTPWADLITGYTLATIVAAWTVGTGCTSGVALDLSMLDLAVSRFNQYLGLASLGQDDDDPADESCGAVSLVLPTAGDGAWLAVTIASDRDWREIQGVLGNPSELAVPMFNSPEHRHENRRVLANFMAALVRSSDTAVLLDSFRRADVAASRVLTVAELIEDPHLRARGFFAPVDHPVWGERRLVGMPWRFSGEPPISLGAPPLLGERKVPTAETRREQEGWTS